jgi:hypothetical protein
MWSKDFKYKVILTSLFASGTVAELSNIFYKENHIANLIYVFFLMWTIFNINDMVKRGYLWPLSYSIIGLLSIIEISFSITGFKEPVLLSKIFSGIEVIVFLISVNYLSNHYRRNEKEEEL